MTTQQYFVLFADLLGFKRLVLGNKVPFPENLNFRDRPIIRPSRPGIAASGNALSEAFNTFHGGIQETLNRTAFQRGAKVYVFSDSLFVASESAPDCFLFAERLMRHCLAHEAPIRMGIGYGTFVSYGFAFDEYPNMQFISSQFFGSGVIRATEAEKALTGLGMRIAVHSSAAISFPNADAHQSKMMALENALPNDVSHEWNYLDEWPTIFAPGRDPEISDDAPAMLLKHVRQMRAEAPPDKRIQDQYGDTEAAIERMIRIRKMGVQKRNTRAADR